MPTLVLIHLGDQWPHYLHDCIHQARLTNPKGSAEVLLIVNQCHAERCIQLEKQFQITVLFVEGLPSSEKHSKFLQLIRTMVDLQFRKNYWQYVFERFFILEMLYEKLQLSSTYMMETDNMLYVPLQIVETTETLFSQGMAAPFDNLEQGYPSIVFFRNQAAISCFTSYMLLCLSIEYLSDMKILGKYRLEHPELVFSYPVLPHCCNDPPRARTSLVGHTATAEQGAFLTDPKFPIVFDAIAFGQAIGGIDPRNTEGQQSIGYPNESALYTVQETKFGWFQFQGLWFPLVNSVPLVNLHIHSKALSSFLSNRKEHPSGQYNPRELQKTLENDLNAKFG